MISTLYFSPIFSNRAMASSRDQTSRLDRQITLHDLLHLLLDAAEVVVGEGAVGAEVVEEAVLDHRADGDLGAGEELLHRHGHEVGGGVADGVDAGFGLGGDDLDFGTVGDGRVDVDDLAVDLAGDGVFRQPPADRRGDVGDGGVLGDFTDGAVGKLYVHECLSCRKQKDRAEALSLIIRICGKTINDRATS